MRLALRWRASRSAIAAAGLAAVVAACAPLQPSRVESTSLYALTAAPLARTTQVVQDVVIEVAPPRAWPGFDTAQMAYAERPYELDYFASSRWVATPSRMLAPILARALEETGSFRNVVQTPSAVAATYRLDTEIVRLVQDFSVKPSKERFTIRAQLTDVRAKRVVASRMLEEVEDAPSENAAGGAAAANAALQRALGQIAEFCVAATGAR